MTDPSEPAPPGEEPSSTSDLLIGEKLEQFREAPLIGLEFLIEIQDGPSYKCALCNKSFSDDDGVLADVVSVEHRMAYLKRYFPKAHGKFIQVKNMKAWEGPTFDFLESVAMRIETRNGRLNPTVVRSRSEYDQNQTLIIQKIDNGPHFSQCPDQDFANLPDPFGSYRNKLTANDFGPNTIDDKGLDHIEDPGMQSLMQREIERFREREKVHKNEASGDNKTRAENVMAKLASMRESLNREEKELYEKYRKGRSDVTSENPVKEIGGSQNADNSNVVFENESRPGPSQHNYTNRLVRTANYLKEDLRSRRNDERRPYDDRHSASRERRRNSRSTSRERRPRWSPERRARRVSRSPSPRRVRRSRSRSRSPFSKHHDRWSKFSIAFRVMEQGMTRKKEIFDKRPEDHPAYPEEWRIFWEKRYKELQAEGKDADNHDYKEEWIPFWEKRVAEIFDEEVRQKTADLLKKYDLDSAEEPRRPRPAARIPEPVRADTGMSISEYMQDYQNFRANKGEADFAGGDRRSFSPNRRQGRSRSRSRERSHHRSRDRLSRDRDRLSSRHPFDERRRSPDFGRDQFGYYGHDKISPPTARDDYSGLSTLERMRDSGVSKSPDRRSGRFSLIDDVQSRSMMGCLRLLTALEDLLGSLGPQINALMSRSLALEKSREGSSNLLLEDPDIAAILEMTKEKLAGLVVAGLLTEQQEYAVRNLLERLQALLATATKKRPLNPPNLLIGKSGKANGQITSAAEVKAKLKHMFAEILAKQLMQRGRGDITDHDLHKLVYSIAEKTELDDGTLAPPPPTPPPVFVPQQTEQQLYSNYSQMRGGMDSNPVASSAISSSFSDGAQKSQIYDNSKNQSYGSTNEAEVVDIDDSNLDEFDELTMEELRSLLDNFKNLSKSEQMDLVQYMRKLETTDPEKVRQLKDSTTATGKNNDAPTTTRPTNESNRNEPRTWSPLRKRAGNDDDGAFNPSPPDPKRPAMATSAAASKIANPLASVVGAITAPPPPPPPPEDEPMFGRYQPPPPPPTENAYYGGGPPQQQGYGNPGLMGQYPGQSQMTPGGNYGNYDGGYSGGNYPGQGYPGNQGGPGGYQSRGGGPPSLMNVTPFSNPNPRSLSYQGSKPLTPINPLFANQQQQQGGYGGYGAGGYGGNY